jgi:dinuclear metal center YbgI/SA1388 family protein
MKLTALVEYLDKLLRISDIEDESLNGLQVENTGTVNKIALAVDGSAEAFEKAKDIGADFIFVHHGLFWSKPFPLRGPMYRRIRSLVNSNIALYAVHLPLDLHSEFGNNAQVQKVLGWPITGDFGEYHGEIIGKEICFKKPVPLSNLVSDMESKLGCEVRVWDFGKKNVSRLGYVSGGGLGLLDQAVKAGFDVFVTGEPRHGSYWIAKEAGINVIFGGHYATETLGVKAVGDHINKQFGLETVFIDLPTGL